AIAGSRVTGTIDDASDIDLYVYAATPVALADRIAVARQFAARYDVGNDFWEPGDEWVAAGTGLLVDIMYRSPAWIEAQLDRILVRHEASIGCSTCFWHNVVHSVSLFDRNGWFSRLQSAVAIPYPEPLRRAVVAKNYPILRQTESSYLRQIERAVRRHDSLSIQHRVTALLASYFDILFAVNALPHPGEKGLLAFATTRCRTLPPGMEAGINALLDVAARPATPEVVHRANALLDALDAFIAGASLLPAPRSAPPVQ
ncbi:MAG: DUF4037 domain-containing protein, partial [Chloroflexota bacterium]|nr:DUF4037 domain-containing protein [Chloroflexota bacterium]